MTAQRVKLSNVLWFANVSRFALKVWDSEVLADGGAFEACFNASELRVTLVWTDPPGSYSLLLKMLCVKLVPADALPYVGSLSASKALVNDLDLVVIAPNGTVHMGNGWTRWDEAHGPHAVPDSDNNCEQVRIGQGAGVYTIRVRGANVPLGPQAFALVATGRGAPSACVASWPECPSNCSGRGACRAGRCDCEPPSFGADCGLDPVPLQCGAPYRIALSSGGQVRVANLPKAPLYPLYQCSTLAQAGVVHAPKGRVAPRHQRQRRRPSLHAQWRAKWPQRRL